MPPGEAAGPPPLSAPPPACSRGGVHEGLWAVPRASERHRRRAARDNSGASPTDGRANPTAASAEDARERFQLDWEAAVAAMAPAPDESKGFAERYLYSWMSPFLDLAYTESLSEGDLPLPRRTHRARMCGSRLSAAFREEVLRTREAWSRFVERTREDGCDGAGNPLSEVTFRGEPHVRGRLRWVGCLRASNSPHRLYAGVEWEAEGPVPAYRAAMLAGAVARTALPEGSRDAVLHRGAVHGERLFFQKADPAAPRCSCERVEDLVLVGSEEGNRHRPRTPSLFWVMLLTFRGELASIVPPALYFVVCQLCNPILLEAFVAFLGSSRRHDGVTRGVVLVVLLTLQKLTGPVAGKKDLHRSERLACLFQSATLAALFEGCLTASPEALADPEFSAGRILTMASSDVENIRTFAVDMLYLFLAPCQLLFYVVYLYSLVGWSALAAIFAFVVSTPAQGLIAKVQSRVQERLSACIDRRLRGTNELLSGIRIVKTMGWESRFLHSIEDRARAEEQRERRRFQMVFCLSWLFVDGTTCLMACSVLFAYVLSGHALTASVAFPVISIIGSISFPIMMMPQSITSLIKFLVSTRRVGRFLASPDHVATVRDLREIWAPRDGSDPDIAIALNKVDVFAWVAQRLRALPRRSAASVKATGGTGFLGTVHGLLRRSRFPPELEWEDERGPESTAAADTATKEAAEEKQSSSGGNNEDDGHAYAMVPKTLLHNVQLPIQSGKLTVIVGATGSGKSSVLHTILGVLGVQGKPDEAESGVWASRDIAYVPQQPWIMQDSIRANITFFEHMGAARESSVPAWSRLDTSYSAAVTCSPLWRRRTRGGRPVVHVTPTREEDVQNARIAAAVRCCQLDADLRGLVNGVDTEIGERGVNMSGGQKARVGLARAVYADRSVYLLDDPLSAVDVHVGRGLMRDVVLGALKGKTRVLVTHQVSVLPDADVVVMMRGGEVHFTGSYAEYVNSPWRHVLEKDLAEEAKANSRDEVSSEAANAVNNFSPVTSPAAAAPGRGSDRFAFPGTVEGPTADDGGGNGVKGDRCPDSHSHSHSKEEEEEEGSGRLDAVGRAARGGGVVQQMIEEEKTFGRVPWFVYRRLIKAGGGVLPLGVALAFFTENMLLYLIWSIWLSLWATGYFTSLSQAGYLAVYIALAAVTLATQPLRYVFLFRFLRRACGRLHESLLYSIASAKVSFFDQTPLGRIVNRFSKDFYVLDDRMADTVGLLVEITNFVVLSLCLTCFTAPGALLFVAVAAVAFWRLLRYYATIIREIRRRSSIAQSPLFCLLEEVTTGRESIDAYGKAHELFEQALARVDKLYSARYVEKMTTVWLSVRVEFLSAGIMIAVALAGLFEKAYSSHDVLPAHRISLLSLALTMSLDLFWNLAACIEYSAAAEADMNSAQRVFHYLDSVPHEDLLLQPRHGSALLSTTAEKGMGGKAGSVSVVVDSDDERSVESGGGGDAPGSLEFRHVDVRYRPGLPLALRDVSFKIAPKEKVGVVGRTGSGKSTLLQVFMRLVEVCGGSMLVGGRPAEQLTLPSLRGQFAMIPQDPVLFQGTVRSNIDPFGESSDAEVLRVLQLVGLGSSAATATAATSHPQRVVTLESVVMEGGSNFSVGQRQLLCLARALLKKGSGFILMDEATANIDPLLDRQVQKVVHERFQAYTVVTVAHRLHTVAGYDRVFVMNEGRLVETGSPRALVMSKGSLFHRMVVQTVSRKAMEGRQQGEGAVTAAAAAAGGSAVGSPTTERERREEAAVTAFLRFCKPED